jgi:hypothetical protein
MSMYADRVLTMVRLRNTVRNLAEEHVSRLSALAPCAIVLNDTEASAADPYGYGRARDYARDAVKKPRKSVAKDARSSRASYPA